jgi:hypothetical protein
MPRPPWSHRLVVYVDEHLLRALQRFRARRGAESTSQALRMLIGRPLKVRAPAPPGLARPPRESDVPRA